MTELELQAQVADYLRLQYHNVLFHSDFGSGIKLTKGQAVKQKRLQGGRRAWPDMFISEPKCISVREGYDHEPEGAHFYGRLTPNIALYVCHGLYIELKKDGEKLYPGKRATRTFLAMDNKRYKTEHLQRQANMLVLLRQRGYAAYFAVGFDEAKKIIDEYLGGPAKEEVEF